MYMKEQFARQWHKDKQSKWHKKERRRQAKQKIRKKKLPICLPSRKSMLMRKLGGRI